MATYKITVDARNASESVANWAWRNGARYWLTAEVEATTPSVAIKRLLDGGWKSGRAGPSTTGANVDRLRLQKGERIEIGVERVK